MRWARIVGPILLTTALLVACSRFTSPFAGPQPVAGPAQSPDVSPPSALTSDPPPAPAPVRQAVPVRFLLFDGPLGLRNPDDQRAFEPGSRVTIGVNGKEIDVIVPGEAERAVRQAIRVEGATLQREAQWLPGGGLSLQLAPGKVGEQITISVRLDGVAPVVLTLIRAAQASVVIDQRYQNEWRPITVLGSSAAPGSAEVRFTFSKPVRQDEVEKALASGQSSLVRGRMEWLDERTMVWQLSAMPSRLDFLLGGAHDSDGLPLPGGIPSVRIGDPPTLVEVNTFRPEEILRGTLPPDIVSAELTPDGNHINLTAWKPGTNRWDWSTVDLYLTLTDQSLKTGSMGTLQPRVPIDLEQWVVNPQGTTVAGLRTERRDQVTTEPHKTELIVLDLRGGRQATVPGFLGRFISADPVDQSTHLVWSSDGTQVAALAYKGDSKVSDLVIYDIGKRTLTTLMSDLPVPAFATRLAWSPDGRYMLAGTVLIDFQAKVVKPIAGSVGEGRGLWEKEGSRLLFNRKDWGEVLLIDPASGEVKPLGEGVIVGWAGPGRAYIIRWPGSGTRYLPPGL